MQFLLQYQTLFDLFLIGSGFALSQFVVLRAGVFSVATAGLASIGAYSAAILSTRYGMPMVPALLFSIFLGAAVSALLAIPLARLRGVFQAIATLAFVQIVIALAYYNSWITGGAVGLNGIPLLTKTWHLVVAVGVVFYILVSIEKTALGRAFNALRQNEAAAATLGVSIRKYHTFAFAISGAIAGLFGGLQAFYVFALTPNTYGFHFIVTVLAYVVLGGRTTVFGPIVGTAILLLIPEIFRPFADYRMLINGLLLIAIMAYLPRGLADSVILWFRQKRAAKAQPPEAARKSQEANAG